MTAPELTAKFNNEFGFGEEWPAKFEVDAETYGNCCQAVFNNIVENRGGPWISLKLGLNCGLMFKNVELIIK